MKKNKCFEQILVAVSFTTDHDEQFNTHFTYPHAPFLIDPPLQLGTEELFELFWRIFENDSSFRMSITLLLSRITDEKYSLK